MLKAKLIIHIFYTQTDCHVLYFNLNGCYWSSLYIYICSVLYSTYCVWITEHIRGDWGIRDAVNFIRFASVAPFIFTDVTQTQKQVSSNFLLNHAESLQTKWNISEQLWDEWPWNDAQTLMVSSWFWWFCYVSTPVWWIALKLPAHIRNKWYSHREEVIELFMASSESV